MAIGILTAMEKEHDGIAALLTNREKVHDVFDYTVGRLGEHWIVLRQCGIGKVNAAVSTAELIHVYEPRYVISTGVAGGLSAGLGVMDVVVSERLVQHDFDLHMGYPRGEIQGLPRFFQGDAWLVERAMALGLPTLHKGLIATGDQFITDEEARSAILAHFPDALAVDMESCAIAQVCHLYKTPFVSFRIISDTPGVENHQAQYEDFWGEMAAQSFEVTRLFLTSIVRALPNDPLSL